MRAVIRRPLLAAAACALLAATVYLAVVHVPALQRADLRTLEGFMGLQGLSGSGLALEVVPLFIPRRSPCCRARWSSPGWSRAAHARPRWRSS